MIGTLANQGMNYLATGTSPKRLGDSHPNIAPYEAFPTEDGWFVLAVGNDEQFRRFCAIVEIPYDDQLATNEQRITARDMLRQKIVKAVSTWKRDDLLSQLEKARVPAGPINTVGEAFEDPHVKHRKLAIDVASPDGGTIPGIRSPIQFSRSRLATETEE